MRLNSLTLIPCSREKQWSSHHGVQTLNATNGSVAPVAGCFLSPALPPHLWDDFLGSIRYCKSILD